MSTLEVYSLTNDDHFYYRWLYFFGKTWGDKFKQDKITFAPNVPFPHAQRLLLLAKTRQRRVLKWSLPRQRSRRPDNASADATGRGRGVCTAGKPKGGRKSCLAKIPRQRPREKARPEPVVPAQQRRSPEGDSFPVSRHPTDPTATTAHSTRSRWVEASRS